MAPPDRRRRPSKPGDQRTARGPRRGKPKFCVFCAQRVEWVDYKDVNTLRRFLSERGKIRSRENTGTCKRHQREVAVAIKTARELALLPYAVAVPVTDRPGGRGGRGGPRGDGPRTGRGEDGGGPRSREGSVTNRQPGLDVGEAPTGGGEDGEGEGLERAAPPEGD